ncbi:hypothetical protein ACUHMQ_06685 [Chitinimonas sp. PSY-7]|uniref:hypothetical protein n=1 Tax=Chitinimonas sp. PSY-7 TaxID=3459088 RepID=UPI00404037F0
MVLSIAQVALALGYLLYMLVGEVNFSTATTGPVVLWTGLFFVALSLLFLLNAAIVGYGWRKDWPGVRQVAKYFLGGVVLSFAITLIALWLGEQRVQQSKQVVSANHDGEYYLLAIQPTYTEL